MKSVSVYHGVTSRIQGGHTNGDGEGEERNLQRAKNNKHRMSLIDNEDVSQSVSETIKRYLRMARKKSLQVENTEGLKRVNYDTFLRNIKAKGEINPPGMNEGNNKAIQTLDAWPLIALNVIQGKSVAKVLKDAHLEWQETLNERIEKKLLYDKSFEQDKKNNVLKNLKNQNLAKSPSQKSFNINKYHKRSSLCSETLQLSSSLPTSPTNLKQNGLHSLGDSIHKTKSFLECGSHILSYFLHDSATNFGIKQNQTSDINLNRTLQKSNSSSNVSEFVSRGILRKHTLDTHDLNSATKWYPNANCTWISDTGELLLVFDSSLEKLSEAESRFLRQIAVAKLSQLNIGINISPESACSTFGNSVKCILSRNSSLKNHNRNSKHNHSSRNSISSLFWSSSKLNKFNSKHRSFENLRSCTSSLCDKTSDTQKRRSNITFSSFEDINHPEIPEWQSDIAKINLHVLNGKKNCYENENLKVPNFITLSIQFLENNGLDKTGLFRVGTSKKRLQNLRDEFNSSKDTEIHPNTCPHDIATLLKEFFRELPEPLLCSNLYHAFLKTQNVRNRRLQMEAISHLIKLLPSVHRDTLFVLLKFLAKVAASCDDVIGNDGAVHIKGNRMDSINLATVFAPNILRLNKSCGNKNNSREHDLIKNAINVVRIMIDHYEELFRVPAELMDTIYSAMLDKSPDQLYTLLNEKKQL